MWNNLVDNARKAAELAAEKTRRAVVHVEEQLNESVGVVATLPSTFSSQENIFDTDTVGSYISSVLEHDVLRLGTEHYSNIYISDKNTNKFHSSNNLIDYNYQTMIGNHKKEETHILEVYDIDFKSEMENYFDHNKSVHEGNITKDYCKKLNKINLECRYVSSNVILRGEKMIDENHTASLISSRQLSEQHQGGNLVADDVKDFCKEKKHNIGHIQSRTIKKIQNDVKLNEINGGLIKIEKKELSSMLSSKVNKKDCNSDNVIQTSYTCGMECNSSYNKVSRIISPLDFSDGLSSMFKANIPKMLKGYVVVKSERKKLLKFYTDPVYRVDDIKCNETVQENLKINTVNESNKRLFNYVEYYESSVNLTEENDIVLKILDISELIDLHNIIFKTLQSELINIKEVNTNLVTKFLSISKQMLSMKDLHDREIVNLHFKIKVIKNDSNCRILDAKKYVDDMQIRLKDANLNSEKEKMSRRQMENIIQALRDEGKKLAKRQNEMKNSLKDSKGQMKKMDHTLKNQRDEWERAKTDVERLEVELRNVRATLAETKNSATQFEKLKSDLTIAIHTSEQSAARIVTLENEIKVLNACKAESINKSKLMIKEKESMHAIACAKIKKLNDDIIKNMEIRIRKTEIEANLKEDALRNEIRELRKRWKDAVTRSDVLNVNLQQTSAPLIRQMERNERNNRVRAAEWADLEMKLRSDFEGILNENKYLRKKIQKLIRKKKMLEQGKYEIESKLHISSDNISSLQITVQIMEKERNNMHIELNRGLKKKSSLLQSTKEFSTNSKCEIMKLLRESNIRNQSIIESLLSELQIESEKRSILEKKIEVMYLTKGSNFSLFPETCNLSHQLINAQHPRIQNNGTDIFDKRHYDHGEERKESYDLDKSKHNIGCFAFMEQLCLDYKAAKLEIEVLREQLQLSTDTRKYIESDLEYAKDICTNYAVLEAMTSEMENQISEKDNEILCLHEDMSDMRVLYHSHLDSLVNKNSKHSALTINSELLKVTNKIKSEMQIEEIASSFGVL